MPRSPRPSPTPPPRLRGGLALAVALALTPAPTHAEPAPETTAPEAAEHPPPADLRERPFPQRLPGYSVRAAVRERIGERLLDGPLPDQDEVLAVLDRVDPDLADRVREAPASPPRVRLMLLRERLPEVLELVRLRRIDPEGFELRARDIVLERETRELARKAAATPAENAEERAGLRERLKVKVRAHFALRRELRERELELIAARLEQLRAELERRDAMEDKLVRERLAELEAAADEPGW